jgi:hypothetical protein
MGATVTYRREGQSLVDFFTEEFRFAPDSPNRWRIIDSSRVGGEFYAVAEYEAGEHRGQRFALVVLVSSPKRERGYNIRYKEMSECSGPHYYRCPARLLALLSPVTLLYPDSPLSQEWAQNWRQGCRDVAASNRGRVTVKHGATVEFAEPITFSNKIAAKTFRYVKGSLFALPDQPGFHYRIPRWRERAHTVAA